jgi:hypothetical protein
MRAEGWRLRGGLVSWLSFRNRRSQVKGGDSMINFPIDTSRFDPRVFHPRFRARNFAVRAIEKQLGTRLTDERVMWLFNCNLNVARQTRSRRWEAAMRVIQAVR